MFTLTTLASGSAGNCILLSGGGTHLLVDAGISCRRISRALEPLGLTPADLSGILITHEHSDHISGLATMTKHFQVPVYTSPGTARQLCYRIAALEDLVRPYAPGSSFCVGGLEVESFPTSHDAAEPMGYTISDGRRRAAVVTDLGMVTPVVSSAIAGAHVLVVESNHDVEFVQSGPYPYYLKQRILGQRGHLSNEAAAGLARTAVEQGAHTVLLAHLSAENNTPQRARTATECALAACGARVGQDVTLAVPPRAETGQTYPI